MDDELKQKSLCEAQHRLKEGSQHGELCLQKANLQCQKGLIEAPNVRLMKLVKIRISLAQVLKR